MGKGGVGPRHEADQPPRSSLDGGKWEEGRNLLEGQQPVLTRVSSKPSDKLPCRPRANISRGGPCRDTLAIKEPGGWLTTSGSKRDLELDEGRKFLLRESIPPIPSFWQLTLICPRRATDAVPQHRQDRNAAKLKLPPSTTLRPLDVCKHVELTCPHVVTPASVLAAGTSARRKKTASGKRPSASSRPRRPFAAAHFGLLAPRSQPRLLDRG